jgi:predicted transcriptional regulator
VDKLKDMNTMIDKTLTELETKTLTAIANGMYAEPGFSDIDVNDVSEMTDLPTKTIRGALGSLVKKGIIQVDTNDSGYDIIYLCKPYWYLVNENWAADAV